MLILALDTSSKSGSICLARGPKLLDYHIGDSSLTQGERLPGDIHKLLRRNKLRVSDVDVYAVVTGPGSFTGLRVGIATIQGLALPNTRTVVPVSTLAVLARIGSDSNVSNKKELIAVFMDAGRGEVFTALYKRTNDVIESDQNPSKSMQSRGVWQTPIELNLVGSPTVDSKDKMLDNWKAKIYLDRICLVGDGALLYRRALAEGSKNEIRFVDPIPCLAPSLAAIAWEYAMIGGTVLPHAIQPVYIRGSYVELARERMFDNLRRK